MQRPQHGNMLSQLSCSWAMREPIRIPTASLHRGNLRVQTTVLLSFHKSLGRVCVCVCVCVRACIGTQLCLSLYDIINCSLPGSSVHRIFQARTLEWVAISYSRGSSPLRDQICVSYKGKKKHSLPFSMTLICKLTRIGLSYYVLWLPWWHSGEESTCNAGDAEDRFSLWVRKIPWRWAWQPTLVFLLRKSHGQRSMVGYGPWCDKESDRTAATENVHSTMYYIIYDIPYSAAVPDFEYRTSDFYQN